MWKRGSPASASEHRPSELIAWPVSAATWPIQVLGGITAVLANCLAIATSNRVSCAAMKQHTSRLLRGLGGFGVMLAVAPLVGAQTPSTATAAPPAQAAAPATP